MKVSRNPLYTVSFDPLYYIGNYTYVPITVAVRSKAWNILARSKAGIVSLNPIQGTDVCLFILCLCCPV
jgi:hypothetical protein